MNRTYYTIKIIIIPKFKTSKLNKYDTVNKLLSTNGRYG